MSLIRDRVAVPALLVAAMLSGCSTMTHTEPPSDWPALQVIERPVSVFEVQRKCFKYLTATAAVLSLGLTMGCAEIDFAARTCTIYVATGENDPAILEHERDHCAGSDHPGDMTLRNAWERYSKWEREQYLVVAGGAARPILAEDEVQ